MSGLSSPERLTFITAPGIRSGKHFASSSCPPSRRRKRAKITACATTTGNASRSKLVSLIGSEYTLKNVAVEEAIDELVSYDEQVDMLEEGWELAVNGRWGLRYSTEPLLGKLLAGNLSKNRSYQLFRAGGVVENVVEFGSAGQLRVEAEYVARPEDGVRGFDYDFKRTRIVYGKLDFTLPFAQGDGYVFLLWLDHALRIDKSLLDGNPVINVYVYEGPVEKCKAELK